MLEHLREFRTFLVRSGLGASKSRPSTGSFARGIGFVTFGDYDDLGLIVLGHHGILFIVLPVIFLEVSIIHLKFLILDVPDAGSEKDKDARQVASASNLLEAHLLSGVPDYIMPPIITTLYNYKMIGKYDMT